VNPDLTGLPLTSSQARQVLRHLFGRTADINPSGPRYYIVMVHGKVLADGHDVFVAIRNAVRAHCERTGTDPVKLLDTALAAYREARAKGVTL